MKKLSVLGFAIIAALTIIFAVIGIIYINNTIALLDTGIKRQVAEIAIQGEQRLTGKLDKNVERLQVIATYINDQGLTTPEKLNRLKGEVEKNEFVRIGYADLTGEAISTDGKNFYVGDRAYFNDACKGKPCISEVLTDRIAPADIDKEEAIIVTSVPVFNAEGEVTAVLFATMLTEQLSEIVRISFFDEKGYSFVMDNNGNVIFHPDDTYLNRNIFEDLAENSQDSDWKYLKQQVQANQQGAIKAKINGIESFIGFANLDKKLNDWNFAAVVPVDSIFGEATQIIRQTIYVTSGLVGIFVFLIIYIMAMKIKNDKALFRLAFIDHLTGINNYNKFYADVQKLLLRSQNKKYAIIYFDIDGFKIINDHFGYAFGDRLLVLIAETLKQVFNRNAVYARLSNDHFAVFVEDKSGEVGLAEIVLQINHTFDALCLREKISTVVVLSAGIYTVQQGEADINKIINKANMAKGLVKGHNHAIYAFFNERIRSELIEENILENEIRIALNQKQFEVYYQPKFSLPAGNLIGMEALIRWPHPEKGFISPASFIPVAEKNDLIVEIGRFVFERVCQDLQDWQARGVQVLPVAVNFSMIELYQKDLIHFSRMMLEKYQIVPELIGIEITETAVLSDLELTIKVIQEFKTMGMQVFMDDFGTGYSSLSYLKTIPIDVLKLDRSFLQGIEEDPRSKNIATSIVFLAKSLDLEIISEGVETQEQIHFLNEIGCDAAQGFYFARPMPKLDLEKFIHQSNLISRSL